MTCTPRLCCIRSIKRFHYRVLVLDNSTRGQNNDLHTANHLALHRASRSSLALRPHRTFLLFGSFIFTKTNQYRLFPAVVRTLFRWDCIDDISIPCFLFPRLVSVFAVLPCLDESRANVAVCSLPSHDCLREQTRRAMCVHEVESFEYVHGTP